MSSMSTPPARDSPLKFAAFVTLAVMEAVCACTVIVVIGRVMSWLAPS